MDSDVTLIKEGLEFVTMHSGCIVASLSMSKIHAPNNRAAVITVNTNSGPNAADPKRAEAATRRRRRRHRRALEEGGRLKPTPTADSLQSACSRVYV